MSESAVLHWFQDSPWGHWVSASQYPFSICETAHFIGLCVLMGALFVVDLRLLGVIKGLRIGAVMKLIPVAVVGFSINLVSGLLLFSSDPFNYWTNPVFKLKLALIVLAGANAIFHEMICKPRVHALADDAEADVQTKIVAALSLGLWTAVIVLGRLLPQFAVNG